MEDSDHEYEDAVAEDQLELWRRSQLNILQAVTDGFNSHEELETLLLTCSNDDDVTTLINSLMDEKEEAISLNFFFQSEAEDRNQSGTVDSDLNEPINDDDFERISVDEEQELSVELMQKQLQRDRDESANQFLARLVDIFPEADVKYLRERAKIIENNESFFDALVDDLTESGYPKVDFEKQREHQEKLDKLLQEGTMEELVEYIEKTEDLDELEKETLFEQKFEKERLKIIHLENKTENFILAEEIGALVECGCCMESKLEEDMSYCSSVNDWHSYCHDCVTRYVEEEIGQGRNVIRCIEPNCEQEFSFHVLEKLLPKKVYSHLVSRRQADEVKQAGLDHLECCPFCDFVAVMPNEDDHIFICLNPNCLKDSCRLCKEPNHVPKTCVELFEEKEKIRIEKLRDGQTGIRTNLENELTEALVRECCNCKTRFFKDEGCNKMTCPSCQKHMCYVCRQPIAGYDHFANNARCLLHSNTAALHQTELRMKATALKQALDPNLNLIDDPTKDFM